MKDQINRFARGVFSYEPIVLEANDNSISAIVDKNQPFCGELLLSSADHREVRGYVVSTNDKVRIEQNGFEGKELRIPYEVLSNDVSCGERIEGNFHVISNGGERSIPYSFQVESGSHDSSLGPIRNLSQFTELAYNNPDEASKLFMSVDFSQVYFGNDVNMCNLYEGLIRGTDLRNNLEEFLVAIGRKNPVHLSLSTNSRQYSKVSENFKDMVTLERDTWGYLNVNVSTESAFIRLERKFIDADSFSGNRYDFSYVVDVSKLHPGINKASITFETPVSKLVLSIAVSKEGDEENLEELKLRHTMKKLTMDLMTLYIRFRTHAIPVEEWIRESRIVLEALHANDENDAFYKLALAQLYITEKQDVPAKALMDEVKDDIHATTPQEYPLYCYFIYVNTLYNKEYAYSKRASAMIRDCYERFDDWRILWTLLFIDEDLENNPSLKLLRIKEQFNRGCHSPVMYLEACRVLNEQPHLLRVMNGFEEAVLYFGAKNRIIEDRLCAQAAMLILNIRYGTEKYIRLMWELYQIHKSIELLEPLCKLLMRNGYVGNVYHGVYEEAIRAQLKITQLFEFYIRSRKREDMSPLPKMVLMYFGYNNSLDYQTKAYLYANIIYNKKDNPQAYRSYQPQMQAFVLEQLKLGHINELLCLVYSDVLTPDMVTLENSGAVSEIFNTYRIRIHQPHIEKVVVRHKEADLEKEYPVVNQETLVRIYTSDAAVFMVSESGKRYYIGQREQTVRLLDNEDIVKRCKEVNPQLSNLALYYCEKELSYHKNSLEVVENQKDILFRAGFNEIYRRQMISNIIDYYYESYDAQAFLSFMDTIQVSELSVKDYNRVIEIYIIQGDYEVAYKLLQGHSAAMIMPKRLQKLCARRIVTDGTEDKKLLEICYLAFCANRYDEITLQYLADYYNGASKDMVSIWKHAMEMGLDTYQLEERIIAQMLFSSTLSDVLYEIFEHYYARGPKERLVEAYLSYFAYEYFVHQREVSEQIFEMIEISIENERNLPLVCGMALVKYYSESRELTAFRLELASKIIYELSRKDYVFPFFLNLQDYLKLPFEVADRTMVEYRANPRTRVVIHYLIEHKNSKKEYISEDMKQVYDGIFVKQFVLFYGESLTYYITEEATEGAISRTTEQKRLVNHSIRPDRTDGRYDAINDLLAGEEAHDSDTLDILLRNYATQEYITEQLFKPL